MTVRSVIVSIGSMMCIITVMPSVVSVRMSYTLIVTMSVGFVDSFLLFIMMFTMAITTSLGTCIVTHKQSEKRDNGYPENVLFHKKILVG